MATLFQYSAVYFPPAPVAEISIRARREVQAIALLDSGADGTLLPYKLLLACRAKFIRTSQLTGVTGKSVLADQYVVEIRIGDLKIPGIKAVSSRSSKEVILGRDVLNHLIVTLDGIAGTTEIS